MSAENDILEGKTSMGIELGSTRIKAVLLSEDHKLLASGEFDWENSFENGIWTYDLADAWNGVQTCYSRLKQEVYDKYSVVVKKIKAIGISAMMHGYLVFDKNMTLLTPFRTWRNNNAENAAKKLSEIFNFNIPSRWSIAHLYHAILQKEAHLHELSYQTTLEGYIHFMLCGQKVIGIGEASGMFPINPKTKTYNEKMVEIFENLSEVKEYNIKLNNIFPRVLQAGENAGFLTKDGAKLLDKDGDLSEGAMLCPPEGDAGTGMIATNSIRPLTGNISAGTSIFSMIVLDKDLSAPHPEIDIVTTPVGDPVAMVHCNNCTSEINTWVGIFDEFSKLFGIKIDKNQLFEKLFLHSLKGEPDCSDIVVFNYLSGENITQIDVGKPMILRRTESVMNLANFMRAQIYSAFTTLKIGLDILTKVEGITVKTINGHGGIFKTEGVFQNYLSAAINAPVSVNKSANEGGAWGMAILASYLANKTKGESLQAYLDNKVFVNTDTKTQKPNKKTVKGVNKYTKNFKKALPVIKKAVKKYN